MTYDPWTVLGWLLVGCASIPLLLLASGVVMTIARLMGRGARRVYRHLLHVATRDIRPARGQVWRYHHGPSVMNKRIRLVTPSGDVKDDLGSWWSARDWSKRTRRMKAYLVKRGEG